MPLKATGDAAGTHRFKFRIDGYAPSNIKTVTGLSLKLDPIITKTVDHEGRADYNVFAGNKQFVGTITVVRLLTEDISWYQWFEKTRSNTNAARVPCFLEVADPRMDGHMTARTYVFERCMANELKISDMNAAQGAAVDETLTFHYTNMLIEPG